MFERTDAPLCVKLVTRLHFVQDVHSHSPEWHLDRTSARHANAPLNGPVRKQDLFRFMGGVATRMLSQDQLTGYWPEKRNDFRSASSWWSYIVYLLPRPKSLDPSTHYTVLLVFLLGVGAASDH